jgi:hypothetical protein
MIGGIPEEVVYIRLGHEQWWKNPDGGWDKTSYFEVLEAIDHIEKKLWQHTKKKTT